MLLSYPVFSKPLGETSLFNDILLIGKEKKRKLGDFSPIFKICFL